MAKTKRPGPLELFGARVRDLRMHQGLSQEQLAAKADRHWTYIGQVERGKRNVTLTTILAIAEGLGITPDVLLAADLPDGVKPATKGRVRPGGPRRPA